MKAIYLKNSNNERCVTVPYFPIGSIHLTVGDYNPGDIFGGEWEIFSQGRCLLGAGTASKSPNNYNGFGELNDKGYYFGLEEAGGQFWHQLTIDEIPNHRHNGLYDEGGNERFQSYGTGTTHTGLINGMGITKWLGKWHTGSTGGDAQHNNMPPYLAVWIWKRIA